jgi:hypothetical protein
MFDRCLPLCFNRLASRRLNSSEAMALKGAQSRMAREIGPCNKHPNFERYKNGACSECRRESCRKWRLAHLEEERKNKRERRKKARAANPEKERVAAKKWRDNNLEKMRRWSRDNYAKNKIKALEYNRKRNYGITREQVRELSQKKDCEICGKKNLLGLDHCFDHDHKTGKFRGILCRKCNTALGSLGDTIWHLRRAIRYLQKTSHKNSEKQEFQIEIFRTG